MESTKRGSGAMGGASGWRLPWVCKLHSSILSRVSLTAGKKTRFPAERSNILGPPCCPSLLPSSSSLPTAIFSGVLRFLLFVWCPDNTLSGDLTDHNITLVSCTHLFHGVPEYDHLTKPRHPVLVYVACSLLCLKDRADKVCFHYHR